MGKDFERNINRTYRVRQTYSPFLELSIIFPLNATFTPVELAHGRLAARLLDESAGRLNP